MSPLRYPRYIIIPFAGRVNLQRHLSNPSGVGVSIGGRVVAVQDGDTFTLLTSNELQYKVRLYGIDAPEDGQAFGNRAKQALSELIFQKHVTVQKRDIDRYRRLVGRVTQGGYDVNLSMVQQGYAWWYREYAKNDMDLERAEDEARSARRGLWYDAHPVPPWEWRKLETAILAPCCGGLKD